MARYLLRIRRAWSKFLTYFFLFLSGLFALIYPVQAVEEASTHFLRIIWSGFVMGGGLGLMLAVVFEDLILQYVGGVLAFTSLTVWITALLFYRPFPFVFFFLLLSTFSQSIDRYRSHKDYIKLTQKLCQKKSSEEEESD